MAWTKTQRRNPLAAIGGGRRVGPALAVSLGLLFSVVTSTFFAVFMVKNSVIPDLYWILRGGQYILAEGRLPASDIFSWSMADKPLLLYQWLFMVLAAAGERLVGLHGLVVLFIAAALAIYFAAPLLGAVPRKVPATFVVLVGGLGLAVITVNMALRPMIATSALLLLQYVVLQRWRRGLLRLLPTAALTAATYLLWANLHNGVALGLVSLLLFALGDLAERLRLYPFDPADPEIEGLPRPPVPYLLLAAVAGLASLVNPYGLGTYAHLADYSSTKFLVDIINETQSPDFHFPQFAWFLVLVAGVFAAMTRATRSIAGGDLLHLAVFSAATFSMQRMVVWAVLFQVLILPRVMHHFWSAPTAAGAVVRQASVAARRAGLLAAGSVVVGLAVWSAADPPPLADRCQAVRAAIADYAREQRPTDRLYNTALVGSCALALERPPRVFFDTRYDFYGERFSKQAIDAESLVPGWRAFLDAWRIDTAIVEKSRALAQALVVDPDFTIVYEDAGAVIARRNAPQSTAGDTIRR